METLVYEEALFLLENKLISYSLESCIFPLELLDQYSHTFSQEHWTVISKHQKLSEDFIEKFADKLYWYHISQYQTLSEDLIEKLQNKVKWEDRIPKYQKLSYNFILKHLDKMSANCLFKNPKILQETKELLKITLKLSS